MYTTIFMTTILLNALASGFFFGWSVSVVLGMKFVSDYSYLESMQNINKKILNTAFFIVFFGGLMSLILMTVLNYHHEQKFYWGVLSSLVYFVGVLGVTALKNVPLNNELEKLILHELNTVELCDYRQYYETNWNRWHTLRSLSSMGSFLILILGFV